jgi:hypothetical protein
MAAASGGRTQQAPRGSQTPKCAVWQGAHNAFQDYIAETGQTPPSDVHWISYGWPTTTPFTTLGQTNWPDGYVTTHPDEADNSGNYAPANYIDGGYAIDFHEFGHDIRHTLDGGIGEFLKDVVRYEYSQNHQQCKLPTGIDDTGKRGFAFNEGWAEFWARTPLTCDDPPHDYRYEGNVAAALTALTVGSPGCPAVSRAGLVKVLAANPGRIHSWDEFLAAFRALHPCDRISLQSRLRTMPVDWGGESIPLSARTLKGRTQIELTQARTALGRIGQLIRRNPVGRVSGCPPNCAVALGQAAAPSLLTMMRAQLQLVQHEIEFQRTGATGDALWRQLTTAKGIAKADAEAHSYAKTSTALTTSAIAQTLKVAIPLSRKRNAQLSKEIGTLESALKAAKKLRPGHLTTWIEGIDSDIHRRIGPSRQSTPTQLALSCAPGTTAGVPTTVTGRLTPAVANQPITIDVTGGPGGGTQTPATSADGSFTATFTPGAAGTYTINGSYAGTTTYGPSSAACTIAVATPAQSQLSLNCPETASPGQALTVTAQLSPPLQGASIDMSATGPGTVPSQTVTTDATGLAYYNFTLGNAGTWAVTAKWAGDATHQATTTTCSIAVKNPSTITLTCPTNLLPPNTPASVNGTLTPAVNGSPVRITYTPPANSSQPPTTDNVTTDDTGYFADSFGENVSGTWTVTAKFAGDATRASSTATCAFTVLSP